ncbi:N-lysine methyltransferase SMYD2-B-like [Oppia nitens]|uniref:N-lysine methyltransferase SMYD2-B-like n=1 Tax=Oppia nitens TaxID=1686743 RepID=UPI0023DC8A51|nr:N-lysine methyltransferase SMYD2-B-like [Oppia nitens]
MIRAEKDYEPYDVVIECQPFVHQIYDRFKGQICNHCLTKSDDLKKCMACEHMYYCDRNCQRNDWRAGHRYECQIFKCHYRKLLEEQQLAIPLLRLYLIIKADPEIVHKMYDSVGGQQRCYTNLMSHREDIVRDRLKVGVIQDIHKRFSSCGVDLPVDDLVDLFGKFTINSFEMVYKDVNQLSYTCGSGLFIGASVLDHSCAPNVYVQSVGNRLRVIADKYIIAGDELTTYYVNISLPTVTRKMLLKKGYYFDCQCSRCDDIDVGNDGIDNLLTYMIMRQLLM